jgi:glutamate synthase (NADPH/NADH) small chain
MGKPTGFLEWERAEPHRRPVQLRILDYKEVELPDDPAETRQQGGRCMDCGVPFCTNGCPLGNPIPDFAHALWTDRWHDAHKLLASTNEFPEFTGRLCPAPCEAACVLAIDNAPVTIEHLERAIIERAWTEGWVQPRPPVRRTNKRIAIVGSGPAGLAAAAHLNRAGHSVTVYESAAKPGGLLRYGIPDFKMEKHVIDRRLHVLEEEGVEFRCGVPVGLPTPGAGLRTGVTYKQLREDHDAVVIAIGSQRARDLDVPGRNLTGVSFAMDFLIAQNEVVSGVRPHSPIDVRGQHVIILGGGDTGSDCLGTALRQGAASVRQIELMPQPPDTRPEATPWPTWPFVFRTSSSQEEGGERKFAFRTTRLEGDAGKLVALHGVQVDLVDGKLVDVPGSEIRLPCDALILALGFVGPDATPLVEQLGVALDARKNVIVDKQFATNVKGVFCAGDAHRGASLIVWAIAEGRDTARAVDDYLRA